MHVAGWWGREQHICTWVALDPLQFYSTREIELGLEFVQSVTIYSISDIIYCLCWFAVWIVVIHWYHCDIVRNCNRIIAFTTSLNWFKWVRMWNKFAEVNRWQCRSYIWFVRPGIRTQGIGVAEKWMDFIYPVDLEDC